MVAASDRIAVTCGLSAGQCHDAPEGRKLLLNSEICSILGTDQTSDNISVSIIMDKAYGDNETRKVVEDIGFSPVVPPKSNCKRPWEYDHRLYKKRNEVERLFRRLKGFRRVFTRYEKLDIMFMAFIVFALIVDALR